jgi:TolB-like protein/class 3 adenylate cyclase/Tfp pilus assembly protein PilF
MSQLRQLAAIMFTDIVGYTALMGNDEQKAFTLLNKNRQLQRPVIEAFNGRWIKELGDGVMASFPTVSDAVNAAIKIQEGCNAANDFKLRIGIHLGEVVFEDDDVFGDGVNIAARIQSAASPGSIFISEAVNNNVSNKKEIETRFVKEEILKNVSQPVRMYQVLYAGSEIIIAEKTLIPIAEKSIAVLPFVNMSNDQEQEYFSDGISEEIINMLVQAPGLKVIGRTSSFAFKGKNMDLRLIGAQLKVTHLLEGSVRRSGNTLRITAQLIDVTDGTHLYSEKFDRVMEDIFAIQDEISLAILNAVKIKLFGANREAVLKRYTDNIEAYQLYLHARFYYNQYTPDAFIKAIEYLNAAIKTDPEYAIAYSSLSYCYLTLWFWNWLPADQCLPQGLAAAQQSLRMDSEIAESHLALGRVFLHYEMNIAEAAIEYKKSIAINPNSAECHAQLGMCASLLGNFEEAKEHANLAENLDPFSLMNLFFIAVPYWAAEDFEKLLVVGKRLVDLAPNFFAGHMWMGIAYQYLYNYEDAIAELELSVQLSPDMLLCLQSLGILYAFSGDTIKARAVIDRMKQIEGVDIVGNNFLGSMYASLGEFDTAFQYYEKAMANHEGNMLWVMGSLKPMPEFNADPRAKALSKKLGLPL